MTGTRLVKASNGGTTLIAYKHDALSRRTQEGSEALHYTAGWRLIEKRTSTGEVAAHYVYSPDDIDAIVLRDRDADADGLFDERLYLLQDESVSITAIASSNGDILERFQYDAYGARTELSSSWTAANDVYDLEHGYQGGRISPDTAYVHLRSRDLNTAQMRWLQQDIAQLDGQNRYQAWVSNPIRYRDYTGRASFERDRSDGNSSQNCGDWAFPDWGDPTANAIAYANTHNLFGGRQLTAEEVYRTPELFDRAMFAYFTDFMKTKPQGPQGYLASRCTVCEPGYYKVRYTLYKPIMNVHWWGAVPIPYIGGADYHWQIEHSAGHWGIDTSVFPAKVKWFGGEWSDKNSGRSAEMVDEDSEMLLEDLGWRYYCIKGSGRLSPDNIRAIITRHQQNISLHGRGAANVGK